MRNEILKLCPHIDTFFPYEFNDNDDDDDKEFASLPEVPSYTVSCDSHPELQPVSLTLRTQSSAFTKIKLPAEPSQCNTDTVTTYVLQLEHGRFYVGITKDFAHRLKQHRGEISGGTNLQVLTRSSQATLRKSWLYEWWSFMAGKTFADITGAWLTCKPHHPSS